jgi:hypothetical protein
VVWCETTTDPARRPFADQHSQDPPNNVVIAVCASRIIPLSVSTPLWHLNNIRFLPSAMVSIRKGDWEKVNNTYCIAANYPRGTMKVLTCCDG